jgi:tetratricopeptide (TPR) repeat protein
MYFNRMISKLIKSFTVFQHSGYYVLILFSMLSLFHCTAFFNTYYNGKIAFDEANQAHKKLMRQFPDSIIIKPNDEIIRKYDRTIEKSKKVIELYEKDKKWHDDALLLIGKAYYYKRENTPAVRKLTQLQKEFPSSPLIPESYFYMAKAYLDLGEFDKAEDLCNILLQKYPSYNKKNEVSLLLVEMAIQRGGRSQAIGLLEKAKKSVRSEEQRIQILLRICELYVDLKQYEKAIALLQKAPRNKDYPQQSFRMDKALFTCYSELGKYDKALQLVDIMVKKKMYEEYHKELLFMKAMVLKRLDRIDDAVTVLKKITSGIDSTDAGKDTSTVVGKAFYELALIYQYKKSDFVQAQKYAILAVQSRDSSVKIQASLLRDAYLQLEKLKNERDSSLEAEKLRFFKIGELFRFELNEPDSAYKRYITIVQNSPDSFKIIPMALSAAAFVAKNNLKNKKRADSLFRVIITKYPASDYGKLAQKELSQPITILTRQDSAYQAFRNAEMFLYGKEPNAKKAITAYYNVFRTYPDIDIAQKSLFTAAWLIDEVLQKNKTARDLYAKLCKRYPESMYCKNEAKPRLDAVEKAIAELKKNRQMSLQAAGPNKELVSTIPSKGGNLKDSTRVTIPDTTQQNTNTAVDVVEPDKDSLDSPISDEPDTLSTP